MSWKVALYDFIHARNRMEVDYDWNGPARETADEAFIERQRLLQYRRRNQHRERGLVPRTAETRLRIRDVRMEEGVVTAGITLYSRLESMVGGVPDVAETSSNERIILRKGSGDKWSVWSVLAENESENRRYSAGTPAMNVQEEPLVICSPPYLNRDKLAPWNGGRRYNREQAARYAEEYWNSYNPRFLRFDVDCSNYVSQCILAGGLPMSDTGQRQTGWWYRGKGGGRELWSYSWAVAHALQVYLNGRRSTGLRARAVGTPRELQLGDVISYCWDGDGRFGHSTVVTAFDPDGMPLVNAHTVNSRRRYWDYSDSYAWTERTVYKFFHIEDDAE